MGVRVRRKLIVVWLVAAFVLLATPVHALAAGDPSFRVSATPDLLPDGLGLGTIRDLLGSTDGFSGTGPCTTDDLPGGYPHAAVYQVKPTSRSLLDTDVRDDLGGSLSLCRVSLYEVSSTDDDPFDAAERPRMLVNETGICVTESSCSMGQWLAAGRTYLLVLWSAPPRSGSPADASFELDASVREPASVGVRVTGHRIKETCTGFHEVITGRNFTVTALTSSDQPVTFILERGGDGRWTPVTTYERTPSGGEASLTLRAATNGRWRVTIVVPGTLTRQDAVARALFHYLTPRWTRYSEGGVRLHVPWYHQRYRLSCEAATLRMTHNYHDAGAVPNDDHALRMIGVDRRARQGSRWGNPNRAFVGNPNGSMMTTGYGVHYGPVASAATKYDRCRPAVRLYAYSRQTVARNLSDGFPVVVWGGKPSGGSVRVVRWTAWDGSSVRAIAIEHTWVVVGFRGTVSNPTSFIIHDPSGRANRSVSLSEFTSFTRHFRTGVVVRG